MVAANDLALSSSGLLYIYVASCSCFIVKVSAEGKQAATYCTKHRHGSSQRPSTFICFTPVVPSHMCCFMLQVSADGKQASTYCKGAGMVAPNDLALSSSGLLYISGQRWTDATAVGDGGMWLCRGSVAQQLTLLGRTNGIELSPDEK